jgi:hypothetical protein
MSDGFILALMILTTFRITWLITRDSMPFVKIPRDWVVARSVQTRRPVVVLEMNGDQVRDYRGGWYYLAELITCPWCVSVWVAAGVTVLTALLSSRGLSSPWLVFGATAAGAAILAQLVALMTDRE